MLYTSGVWGKPEHACHMHSLAHIHTHTRTHTHTHTHIHTHTHTQTHTHAHTHTYTQIDKQIGVRIGTTVVVAGIHYQSRLTTLIHHSDQTILLASSRRMHTSGTQDTVETIEWMNATLCIVQ